MTSVGWSVVVAGALVVAIALVAAPAGRDQVAGWGLAAVMTGLLVVVAGNYLRHAVERDGWAGQPARQAVGQRRDQPSSVPTTETNDTISPG